MSSYLASQSSGFRHVEVKCLLGWACASESASIIGVSGVGKSNLFNHLRDVQTQTAYLGEDARNIVILRINFHYIPDFSARSVYSLILEQLEALDGEAERLGIVQEALEQVGRCHKAVLDAGEDVLKAQRYFKLAMRALLAHSSLKVVFLFDQFDEVYREVESRLFANLRGLREAYKYRVSYLVFTRDLLPNLAETDAGREEFYELLAANVMGLRPYNQDDAHSLLQRVAQRNHLPFIESLSQQLYQLTGGHAALLRATYLAVARGEVIIARDAETAVGDLLQVPWVELECEKLWHSLSLAERRTLAYHAYDVALTAPDKPTQRLLELKGLLVDDKPHLFSPLFKLYVTKQEALWERPLYFDEAARQVWILGRPVPILTQLEFNLFRLLHHREGEVVIKDELIEAGWPQAKGGVSDEALIAAISRLRRKLEPDPKNPRFLRNIHNQGYLLKANGSP